MPLRKGTSRATVSNNIREFHTGKTYARTKAKFGKKTADRQAIVAAMSTKRRSASAGRAKKRSARRKAESRQVRQRMRT